MSIKRRPRGRMIPLLAVCFYAGLAAGWWLHAAFTPDRPAASSIVERERAPGAGETDAPAATSGEKVRLKPDPTGAASPSTDNRANGIARVGTDPIAELRRRGLRLPLDEADIDAMEGDFAERRGGGARGHEAVDILAPRHTRVRAVENGTIAKLFYSAAGGTTIYQFDPAERYCYYYAHLERYAEGLREGMRVSKGDVIGYVGTSGNAPPGTPHLHLAIFELTDAKRWWDGKPIDPYRVFHE